MASQSNLPTAAESGFKDAAAYDAHRPSYPHEAVETFLQNLKIAGQDEVNVLEVASGTGKFTELLAVRPERYTVKAVEPHGPMREKLAQKDLRGVEVLNGKADKMPVESEWGDVCIAAQSFHWFATSEALKEIHRVLRPGAVLGMIWNIDDYNKPRGWLATTKWEQKLNDYIWGFDDGLPRFRHQQWQEVFEQQPPGNPVQVIRNTFADHLPRFSLPLGENKVKWTIWLNEEALWARINTLSQVAILEGEEREAAVKIFKDALQSDDVERNREGEIAVHGVTYFSWTDRI
ncbi:putative methyltransferase protein [Rosellinia necatrix]|uniref:Putative methyltransferase protein n=1 Tax=Rosellinia necatrix TaxID=77044 RepID=A0A1W2TD60_ROSNE|nr:putative methyltransferase protein [Rosellinia necatrix]